jgi:hypothetical protein
VLEDYRHPDIVTAAGKPFELDYFYPRLKLAFEFQGEQHYKSLTYLNNIDSLIEKRQQDINKRNLCKESGITLIEVPYWWDRKRSSLLATIRTQRPELFSDVVGTPIPLSAPVDTQKSKTPSTLP